MQIVSTLSGRVLDGLVGLFMDGLPYQDVKPKKRLYYSFYHLEYRLAYLINSPTGPQFGLTVILHFKQCKSVGNFPKSPTRTNKQAIGIFRMKDKDSLGWLSQCFHFVAAKSVAENNQQVVHCSII